MRNRAGAIVLAFAAILFTIITPQNKYDDAAEMLADGRYDEAIAAFKKLGSYRDSGEQLAIAKNKKEVMLLLGEWKYAEAYDLLKDDPGGQEALLYENAVAFCFLDYYQRLEYPDSFRLREVWIKEKETDTNIVSKHAVVLKIGATNSYGDTVSRYAVYTWDKYQLTYQCWDALTIDDVEDDEIDRNNDTDGEYSKQLRPALCLCLLSLKSLYLLKIELRW